MLKQSRVGARNPKAAKAWLNPRGLDSEALDEAMELKTIRRDDAAWPKLLWNVWICLCLGNCPKDPDGLLALASF